MIIVVFKQKSFKEKQKCFFQPMLQSKQVSLNLIKWKNFKQIINKQVLDTICLSIGNASKPFKLKKNIYYFIRYILLSIRFYQSQFKMEGDEKWVDESVQEQQYSLLSYKIKELAEKTLKRTLSRSTLNKSRFYKIKDLVLQRDSKQIRAAIIQSTQLSSNISDLSTPIITKQRSEPYKIKMALNNGRNHGHGARKFNTLIPRQRKVDKAEATRASFRFIKTASRSSSRSSSVYEQKILSLSQIDGQGKLILGNGRIIEADWVNGNSCGEVRITYENKFVYKGPVYDLKPHGKGQMIFLSGKRYVGEFCDGQPHGEGKTYTAEGKLKKQGEWWRGKFVG